MFTRFQCIILRPNSNSHQILIHRITTYTMYGSQFETSHTMTSPLVHPVASREPRDVISMSVHVTWRVFSSDSDWSTAGDVVRSPASPDDVRVVMTSRNSRSTGRSRDLAMSCTVDRMRHKEMDFPKCRRTWKFIASFIDFGKQTVNQWIARVRTKNTLNVTNN